MEQVYFFGILFCPHKNDSGQPHMNYYEKRVKELCANALAATNEDELESVMAELRVALREHALNAENILYSYPVLRLDPDLTSN